MRSPRHLSLVAVLATVALIGCGGDDNGGSSADDAKSALESVQSRASELRDEIDSRLASLDNPRLEQAVDDLRAEADAAAEQLRDVDVPAGLADEREALRAAVERGQEGLDDVVDVVGDADASAVRDAAAGLVEDSEAIRTAREKFEQALDAATR